MFNTKPLRQVPHHGRTQYLAQLPQPQLVWRNGQTAVGVLLVDKVDTGPLDHAKAAAETENGLLEGLTGFLTSPCNGTLAKATSINVL